MIDAYGIACEIADLYEGCDPLEWPVHFEVRDALLDSIAGRASYPFGHLARDMLDWLDGRVPAEEVERIRRKLAEARTGGCA